MKYSSVITPKVAEGWVSHQSALGVDSFDLADLYSPDTEFWKSKVLDLGSPKFQPNKTYSFDRSRYRNHGTITGATWTRLPSGLWFLNFDGINNVVTIVPSASINNLTAFTMLVWVKLEGSINYPEIMGKGFRKQLFIHSTSKYLRAGVQAATTNALSRASAGTTLTSSVWALAGMTYDDAGDRKIRLFKNGVEATSYIEQIAAAGALTDDSASNLLIGNTSGTFWLGGIAQPMIIPAVLSATQQAVIYRRGLHLFGV